MNLGMAGAGPNTLRVKVVNANWAAGEDGADGEFALLIVTEDDERHTVGGSPASMPALLALVRDSPVLLWDPDSRVLIAANLVGDWLPLDWSGRQP
ncbi:MAG TPA: hypothetical protein VI357_00555, partial [Mycobacteriales bacterium]